MGKVRALAVISIAAVMALASVRAGQAKEVKVTEQAILAGGCFWGM